MAAPLPPNPLTVFKQPTGNLAIPSNPLAAKLASGGLLPSPAAPPVRPAPPIPELAAKTAQASRAGNTAYNKASGGTQGVVPGIKAEDLKAIRVQAAKHPQQAALAGSLANPIEWGVQAAKGVPQIIHGAEKAAHGNLSGGGAEAGLGALSLAGVLPFGRVGEAIGLAARAGTRTAAEADAHIAEVAAKNAAEGFGKKATDVLVAPETQVALTPREHIFADVTAHPEKYVFHGTPSEDAARNIETHGLRSGSVAGHWGDTLDYAQGGYVTVFRKSDFGKDFAVKGQKPVAVFTHRDFSTEVPYEARSQELGDPPPSPGDERIAWTNPSVRNHIGSDFAAPLSKTERAAQVREAMQGAPVARGAQKILQSAERGKRFAASAAEAQKHEGVAAYHAAIGQLRGKLPQLNYKGFSELDGQTLNTLLEDIKNHPSLMQGQKITAQRSLLRAVGEGKVPTAGEEKILRTVFGDNVTEQIKGSTGFFKTYKNLALDAANIPRAIMSSADLSAPLRQGLVGMVTHPVISLKAFPAMIKMFGSENLYQASRSAIESDPAFSIAMKAELPLTGIGTKESAANLVGREEAYQSNLAERLNLREIKFLRGLGRLGTGPGDLIRASDRAYTGYLNQVRMDIFKSLLHDAAMEGRDLNDTKLIKDIARFVGSATGRGPLGPLKNHAVSINALFFSPKLLASRLDILLSPVTYLHADPFVRRQALEATFKLVGTMSLVLYLAKLGGAQVGLDPTNADFAKIRIGNTRIDIAGGFQQPVRLAFELAEGKVTSSTTGKTMALSGGIGKTSAGDVALRFIFNKAAPVPGFALQASGVSQASFGPHQALWKQAIQRLIPLLAQDANDLRTTPGAFGGNPSLGKAIGGYGLGVFGVGEQTYAPKAPSNGSTGGWGGGGSGGTSGGWGSGGSGGSSGGWGG